MLYQKVDNLKLTAFCQFCCFPKNYKMDYFPIELNFDNFTLFSSSHSSFAMCSNLKKKTRKIIFDGIEMRFV